MSVSTVRTNKYSRRGLWGAIVAVIASLTMTSLGIWQLQRADDKHQRLTQIEQRQQRAPLSIYDLPKNLDQVEDYPLTISGNWQKEYIFLLDNRINNGRVGYEVLIPMEMDMRFVLVNLGWINAPKSRNDLPDINVQELPMTIQGTLYLPRRNPAITETANSTDTWPMRIQQVDIALMSRFFGSPLAPFVVLADPDESSKFVREWTPVVMSPQKHLGYAIQWFALAAACIIVTAVAIRKGIRSNDIK
ncbi:SURF1 family protein [Aestuariibacter sp. AA17]|uniref:SURF1-like protein n=1 Tax=Fluctibacter corallii TaxID=2984329 RepID=A0ABT3AAY9_9ALTE|nr:SURF1 family protein [Aestuariibacter sp. AA17]MCV2885839.1 SURF1 family protein [Aestuariibacter sp. AA17]